MPAWQGAALASSYSSSSSSPQQHHRPRRKRVDGVAEESVRQFGHAAKSRSQQSAAGGSAQHVPQDELGEQSQRREGGQDDGGNIRSQEEFRSLVDFYGPPRLETWKEQEEREVREAEEREKQEAGGGGPTLSGDAGGVEGAEIPFHEMHRPWPNNDEVENASIGELEELLEHDGLSPEIAYEIYTTLSWPRAAYLSYSTIRNLLHCLGVVEHHEEAAMLRYLSVIDDMKAAEIPIAVADWNMAIQFAGKCFRKITNNEVESALYLWREMEHRAGTKGNHVTFNILFDIAVKAGKYKLAEMVRNEMLNRGLKLDRYFRTSVILWRGLTRDGEGVRTAYKELVDAGEIVDTTVMNCVITALCKASEPAAAEQVFLRMKNMHGSRQGRKQMPRDWRQRRELGYLLTRATEHVRGNPEAQKQIQEESPVGPDYATFKILIEHHAITSGNIDRVTELLDEMDRIYDIPLKGDMFYTLLFGFYHHGGVRYTSWTKGRLESTWRAFIMSLEKGGEDYFLDRSIVTAAILAFSKCMGKEKTLQVWEEIRNKWNPPEADLEHILKRLALLFPAATAPVPV
ncbi:hypothetical protein MPH_01191 [Macrophomina phaseolina MS6]|uniref:Pentatricopeptide repeat-containing protein n=2 Tax=Macrophomina phaseolina TaxID=35725 RepID=K2SY22_MACPH|nr:hypothetical protein MPH_01191 [Macrophomina phaseolina MS6]